MKSSILLNPVLTGLAATYLQEQPTVGRRLFPILNTAQRAAPYYVLDSSSWLNVPSDIRHAPGASFKRGETTVTDDSYFALDYGIEELIPKEEVAQYASFFDARKVASNRAVNSLLINHELRVKAKATGAGVPTSSPTVKWNSANSDPKGDIDAAIEAIYSATGLEPNTIVLPRIVRNALRNNAAIKSLFTYTRGGIVSDEMLADALGIRNIVIAGTQVNTANEGAASAISQIWGDSVVLAVVNDTQDLKAVNFGRTFNWTAPEGSSASGVGIYQYDEDPRDSVVVRARQFTDEKLTGPTAGYHLSDVLS